MDEIVTVAGDTQLTTGDTKNSLTGFFAAVFGVTDMDHLEAVVSTMMARWNVTDRPGHESLTGVQPSAEIVTISAEELEELRRDSLLLECIQDAGVDNWGGWDYALETFRERGGEL